MTTIMWPHDCAISTPLREVGIPWGKKASPFVDDEWEG